MNDENVKNILSKNYQENTRTVEIDGNIFIIKREFSSSGMTILDGIISMLLDKMEEQEKNYHN
ncbi:MAG: hypothetical protein SOZ32_02470 [Bacilli bacterium]|nr:hypothetical protein [Mollicutes bacterium]MDY3899062.1 hypothetical protein [Bacilli bacterium]